MKKDPCFSLLKNHRGISLIETLIAMAILMIVSIGTATVVSNIMKLNRNIMATTDANSTLSLLSMYLADQATCDLNLVTENVVQFDTTLLKDLVVPVTKLAYPTNGTAPKEYLYNKDEPLKNDSLAKITNVTLSDFRYLNLTSQTAKLNLTFDKGPQVQGPQFIQRSLFLKLESQVVSGNVLKVIHCIAGPGTITPPAPTPGPGGSPAPDPGSELPEALFKNLLASVKSMLFSAEKVDAITTTIKNWQGLGLVGKDRYISIAQFSALVKDGDIADAAPVSELCQFLSTHVTDPQNAVNTIPIYFYNTSANDCVNKIGK